MKTMHHAIVAVVLSIVFVIVGFAATLAAIVGPSRNSSSSYIYPILGYTLTLVAFLILLWILMLALMHKDPRNTESASNARRRR